MKLSAQHANGGLSGHIRSVQTGEVVHFQFSRGTRSIPLEICLGDKRLEVSLRIEPVDTDPGDDLDVELTFRAPDISATSALDYTPRIAPPAPGGFIDQDGSAMAPLSAEDSVVIQDGPVQEQRDAVLSADEREDFAITPTTLALALAEDSESGLFSGEDLVDNDSSETASGDGDVAPTDEHPATQVPELPGVGGGRNRRSRR